MDHGVDAVERAGGDVAHVRHHQLDAVEHSRERPLAPVQAVQHAHPVAPREQLVHEHAADVSAAAGDEDCARIAGALGRQPVQARVASGQADWFGLTLHGPTP
jgi:hypothetical protein